MRAHSFSVHWINLQTVLKLALMAILQSCGQWLLRIVPQIIILLVFFISSITENIFQVVLYQKVTLGIDSFLGKSRLKNIVLSRIS